MRRKTFAKQLMALGLSRNGANSVCRDLLAMRDEMRRAGRRVYVSWADCLTAWVEGMK